MNLTAPVNISNCNFQAKYTEDMESILAALVKQATANASLSAALLDLVIKVTKPVSMITITGIDQVNLIGKHQE